jgi:hypothetical protein
MTETFAEENHDGAGGHVIIKQALKRCQVGADCPGFSAAVLDRLLLCE